ncbi:MAG: iron ABC transporter permease [Phascolarctobacterium sp.]|nr:iron ABC transporter permease [Phascolarctobacterium sp.]
MLEDKYLAYKRSAYKKIFASSLGVLLVAVFCLIFGTDIGVMEAITACIGFIKTGDFTGNNIAMQKIIVLLRMPRMCLAILAGIGLSIAGMMMQSVTRNMLVSPFTLGVSSAAAFGASICIVFGSSTIFFNDAAIIGSAFAASMCSVALVFMVAKRIGITANTIILVGIAMNYFCSALTATLQFFAEENKLAAVVQWTFGSFNRANWHGVVVISVIVLICYVAGTRLTLKWNAMASGDDETVKSLGINPEQLRTLTMILAVLVTATIISFTGVIGFVGLIAPHMARYLVGNDHSVLFPMSATLGAGLLVLADTIGKFILYPVNIPVGIVVSFVGVPIFVQLILQSRRSSL